VLLGGCGASRGSFDATVARFSAESHARRVSIAALPGVVCFRVGHRRAQASIERWNREYLPRDAYVFRYENTRGLTAGGDAIAVLPTRVFSYRNTRGLTAGGDAIAMLPTRDKWRVVRTAGLPAADIAWLQRLDRWQPFTVYGVGVDFVEGRFDSRPHGQDALTLAQSMVRFDPAIGSARELARTLETTGALYMWWD
jgi:hypothetical protein